MICTSICMISATMIEVRSDVQGTGGLDATGRAAAMPRSDRHASKPTANENWKTAFAMQAASLRDRPGGPLLDEAGVNALRDLDRHPINKSFSMDSVKEDNSAASSEVSAQATGITALTSAVGSRCHIDGRLSLKDNAHLHEPSTTETTSCSSSTRAEMDLPSLRLKPDDAAQLSMMKPASGMVSVSAVPRPASWTKNTIGKEEKHSATPPSHFDHSMTDGFVQLATDSNPTTANQFYLPSSVIISVPDASRSSVNVRVNSASETMFLHVDPSHPSGGPAAKKYLEVISAVESAVKGDPSPVNASSRIALFDRASGTQTLSGDVDIDAPVGREEGLADPLGGELSTDRQNFGFVIATTPSANETKGTAQITGDRLSSHIQSDLTALPIIAVDGHARENLSSVSAQGDRSLGQSGRDSERSISTEGLVLNTTIAMEGTSAASGSGGRTVVPLASDAASERKTESRAAGVISVSTGGSVLHAAVVHPEQTTVTVNGQAGRAVVETTSNPFSLMDAHGDNGSERQSELTASAASGKEPSLAFGYLDPKLGYIELQAHMAGDDIHASLQPLRPESGAALEGHLHALAGWMSEHQTPVESLTVLTSSGSIMQRDNTNGQGSDGGGQRLAHSGFAHSGSAHSDRGMAGQNSSGNYGGGKEEKFQGKVVDVSNANGLSSVERFGWSVGRMSESLVVPVNKAGNSISVLA